MNTLILKISCMCMCLFATQAVSAQKRKEHSGTRQPEQPYLRKENRAILSDNKPKIDLAVHKKDYKPFNYFFLRAGYPLTGDRFNNPLDGLPQKKYFLHTQSPATGEKGALELGFVRHFVNVGTPMLMIGLNSSFSLQYFNATTIPESGSVIQEYVGSSDGTVIFATGLGPQLSFKPNKWFRVGLYGRINVTGIYGTYETQRFTSNDHYEIYVKMLNVVIGEDVGLDITVKKLLIGVTASFAKITPDKGSLGVDDERAVFIHSSNEPPGVYTEAVNPAIDFNRITLHLGFGF